LTHHKCDFVYNFPYTEKQKTKLACQGFPGLVYGRDVMGENSIAKLLPNLCRQAGIEEWQKKTPHTLRGFSITVLANDPNTNAIETARTARHKSVRSQESYIGTNKRSEMARLNAMGGMVPPPGPDPRAPAFAASFYAAVPPPFAPAPAPVAHPPPFYGHPAAAQMPQQVVNPYQPQQQQPMYAPQAQLPSHQQQFFPPPPPQQQQLPTQQTHQHVVNMQVSSQTTNNGRILFNPYARRTG
jgi:hypothetical protein